ncbi:MAG: acyl-CoA mutase large subunit family protein [Firmicutes bacterium]|nr:acyl-CoA mutase large subunit family protein [Bacillota bacterium]
MLQMVCEKDATPLAPVSFDEFEATSYEQWKEAAVETLKGAPFEKKLLTKTYEGITLEPLYTEESAAAFAQQLSFPGSEDFLRGVKTSGYIAEPWAVAQAVDAACPKEANAMLKQELERGANAITLDMRGPVRIQDLADLEALLQDIRLCETALNVYCGASALPMLGMLKARADKAGFKMEAYKGCVGADPIGEYALNGKSDAKIECYIKQMAAAIRAAEENAPGLKTIFIQGSVYHNGGANAVQEVAASMATAIAYIDALMEEGLSIEQIAKQIRFGFSLGANFFMEIAKLRAARMVWAQIVKAYGGSDEAAKIDVAASTSAFTATVYDPYVNILRATTQAFSGVVGGISELTVTPFDAAVRPSDELSRRIARNIQVMMREEFNLTSPVDPAGGSWYVETLTGQLAEAIWGKMQQIEADGGILAVLANGSLQDEVAAVLADRFKKLATRADKAVGSNMYANMSEKPLEKPCCCCAPKAEAKTGTAVEKLDHCICCVVDAFAKGAVYADVAKALCCGEAPEIKAITPHRWTEQFEALRSATEKAAAEGKVVKVFLCNMGPIPQHKARADFSASFMEVAGFQVLRNDGFATTDEAIAAAKASGADVAIICSTDDTYPELVPVLAKGIKEAAPEMKVFLAGAPAPELKPVYDEAGVDEYIHVKANCLAILSNIQKERGIC